MRQDVIQIRGLKAFSRREEGQKYEKNVFCFAEPTLEAKEAPKEVFQA